MLTKNLPAPWRTLLRVFFLGALLPLGLLLCLPEARSDSDSIQKLKTAFIFQFTNYIEWAEADAGPFVISVLGDGGLIPHLEELAEKKLVKGREIRVLFAKDLSQLKKSHIIVLAVSDEGMLRHVARKNRGALIVTHNEGFAEKGAMINFFEEADRLRFEINRRALEEQRLQVSSQLLKLARIVE